MLDIKRKVKPLVVPYIIFSVLSFVYYCLVESKFRTDLDNNLHNFFFDSLGNVPPILEQFINIFMAFDIQNSFLYNIVMWFLPCLFISSIVFILCHRYIKDFALRSIMLLIVCPLLFYVIQPTNIRLPWCAELALVAAPVMEIGYLFYKSEAARDFERKYRAFLLPASIVAMVLMTISNKFNLEYRQHIITPPF